jgi:hypothetical protein
MWRANCSDSATFRDARCRSNRGGAPKGMTKTSEVKPQDGNPHTRQFSNDTPSGGDVL